MSASWTVYGRNQLLAGLLTPDVANRPAALYLALLVSPSTLNDDGSQLAEPDPSTGYARTAIALAAVDWISTGFGEFSPDGPVTMGALTSAGPLCVGWALCDTGAIGTGNVWVVGDMPEVFPLDAGFPYAFGDLTLGLYD